MTDWKVLLKTPLACVISIPKHFTVYVVYIAAVLCVHFLYCPDDIH